MKYRATIACSDLGGGAGREVGREEAEVVEEAEEAEEVDTEGVIASRVLVRLWDGPPSVESVETSTPSSSPPVLPLAIILPAVLPST